MPSWNSTSTSTPRASRDGGMPSDQGVVGALPQIQNHPGPNIQESTAPQILPTTSCPPIITNVEERSTHRHGALEIVEDNDGPMLDDLGAHYVRDGSLANKPGTVEVVEDNDGPMPDDLGANLRDDSLAKTQLDVRGLEEPSPSLPPPLLHRRFEEHQRLTSKLQQQRHQESSAPAANYPSRIGQLETFPSDREEVSSNGSSSSPSRNGQAQAHPDQVRISTDTDPSPTSEASPPAFYEVVAEPVSDQVYDAEQIPELPPWKKYSRGIISAITIFFMGLIATIIVVMTPEETEPPTIPPYLAGSCASYTGRLFEANCDGCNPPVGMDVNTTVTAVTRKSINIFSYLDGQLENSAAIDIGYKVGGPDGGVSISGNVAVVGSPVENEYTGAVYVYEKDTTEVWRQTERLSPSDADEGTQFGRFVDIDGDVIVVGAWDFQGSVYVFRRTNNTWIQETKIKAKESMNKDFGSAVKVKGDRMAVGDRWFGNDPQGVVYLYEYNKTPGNWTLEGKIQNEDCGVGRFGVVLELANDHDLLVGCPLRQKKTGAVYHYAQQEFGGEYTLQQDLTASNGDAGDRFGGPQQIGVDGDIMVIGEYVKNDGIAHVFVRDQGNEWTEVAKIDEPRGSAGTYFSDQIALSGNKVVISSSENVYSYDLKDCLPKQSLFS